MKTFFLEWHRKWLLLIAVTNGVIMGMAYLILYKDMFGIASATTKCFSSSSLFGVTCLNAGYSLDALYSGLFLKSVFVVVFILLFLPARAFKWWRWLAIVGIPLGIWGIITTETNLFTPLGSSNLYGVLFFGLSIFVAIIATIYDFFKKRRDSSKSK